MVGLSPWGKGAKVVKKIPKITRLFSRRRKLKNTRTTATRNFTKAQDKTEDAVTSCSRPQRRSAHSIPNAEPIILSDGREVVLAYQDGQGKRTTGFLSAGNDDKKPSLDDLLAQSEQSSKPTPSLEELLASTEGTACANPNASKGPEGKPDELKRGHSDEAMSDTNLDRLRQESTEDLIESLKPGSKNSLLVDSDGKIRDGNHRIEVLRERGVDVDSLPREIRETDLPDDGFWE